MVERYLHAPAALPPGVRAPGIHWIGSWEGPRAGLEDVEETKTLHCRESNPSRPARSLSLYRLSFNCEITVLNLRIRISVTETSVNFY
jgi:hypothetical protein